MERSEPLLSPAKLNFVLLRPLGFGFKEEIEKLSERNGSGSGAVSLNE